MRLLLAITTVVFLLGCATNSSSKQLAKDTKVCVSVEAKDVLYAQAVVAESAIQEVAKRMERHIINYLHQHGIETVIPDALTADDAKLVVKLNAIETEAIRDSAPFSPTFMRQQPIIRYSSLLTANGVTLFNYDHEQSNESPDKLTRLLGDRIGERVSRCIK